MWDYFQIAFAVKMGTMCSSRKVVPLLVIAFKKHLETTYIVSRIRLWAKRHEIAISSLWQKISKQTPRQQDMLTFLILKNFIQNIFIHKWSYKINQIMVITYLPVFTLYSHCLLITHVHATPSYTYTRTHIRMHTTHTHTHTHTHTECLYYKYVCMYVYMYI